MAGTGSTPSSGRQHPLGTLAVLVAVLACGAELVVFLATGAVAPVLGDLALVLRLAGLALVVAALVVLRGRRTRIGASLALAAALVAVSLLGDTHAPLQRALLVGELLLCAAVGLTWTFVLAARPDRARSRL